MPSEIKKIVIQVDSREVNSQVPRYLSEIPGVSIAQNELDTGDYQSMDNLIIERKSAQDLTASIMDKRIFSQVQIMKSRFDKVILLVEGDPYSTRSGIEPVAIDGLISWASVVEGLSVIFSPNTKQSANLIHRMCLHHQHGLGYTPGLRVEKPKEINTYKRYLIEGLPGVGPEMAKKLIDHFGSVRSLMLAGEKELCEVKGMGKTTATKIISILEA